MLALQTPPQSVDREHRRAEGPTHRHVIYPSARKSINSHIATNATLISHEFEIASIAFSFVARVKGYEIFCGKVKNSKLNCSLNRIFPIFPFSYGCGKIFFPQFDYIFQNKEFK